jgi:ribosomal 50S subunit-recycling heat shock protein
MEVRLNKLISDFGICSRREADKYIAEGRVSINGKLPKPGQKVTEHDIVLLDDVMVTMSKHYFNGSEHTDVKSTKEATQKKAPKSVTKAEASNNPTEGTGNGKKLRPGKYVKYNKYAAARHAAKEKAEGKTPKKDPFAKFDKELVKDATKPQFGKSLKRSAVAQRLANAPKSAALRKTSKNNPVNKAKRLARRGGHNNESAD